MDARKHWADLTDREVVFCMGGFTTAYVVLDQFPWWAGMIAWGGGSLLGLGVVRVSNAMQAFVNRKFGLNPERDRKPARR